MEEASLADDRAEGDAQSRRRESRQAREDAAGLLEEFRLLEKWEQHGEAEVGGSYRWDLMLAGNDIDLFVVNPALNLELALAVFTRFVREGDFLAFGFIDSVRRKPAWADPQTYPTGYYLGMARHFRGREWKVETWLLNAPPPCQDWILEQMTDEARDTILRLKQLKRSQGSGFPACSYDIYRAVLLGGATRPEEVQAWLVKEEKPSST